MKGDDIFCVECGAKYELLYVKKDTGIGGAEVWESAKWVFVPMFVLGRIEPVDSIPLCPKCAPNENRWRWR